MSDRHTNSGPGEGELTTEDLARSGRDSRPDSRSGPLSDTGRDAPSEARSGPLSEATGTRSGAPSDTGHDAPSEARSGPLSGARADRTPDTPPPAYPGEATARLSARASPPTSGTEPPRGGPTTTGPTTATSPARWTRGPTP